MLLTYKNTEFISMVARQVYEDGNSNVFGATARYVGTVAQMTERSWVHFFSYKKNNPPKNDVPVFKSKNKRSLFAW